MNQKQLSEIKTGETIEGLSVLVEKCSVSMTKTGKPYLNLNIRDKHTSVSAKLWDYDPVKHAEAKANEVIFVHGTTSEFNGQMQVTITGMKRNAAGKVSDYIKSTRFDIDMMWNYIEGIIVSMTEPLTAHVCKAIIMQPAFKAAFMKAPAAKAVHNAWYGGLIEHVYSLCNLAEKIIPQYQHYQPKLSRDKVMFGLIVHDAGKVTEYDYSTADYKVSPHGIMANHLVMGSAWTYYHAMAVKDTIGLSHKAFVSEMTHLMHILAAHHGKQEWGSPVSPSSLEAVLVHQLDMIDSKMLHAIELIEGKPGPIEGFSESSRFERVPYLNYGKEI